MKNKTVGVIFCFISAMLMCTRYLAASIFLSNAASWNAGIYEDGLLYIGPALADASTTALVVGIIFLAIGILQDIIELIGKGKRR